MEKFEVISIEGRFASGVWFKFHHNPHGVAPHRGSISTLWFHCSEPECQDPFYIAQSENQWGGLDEDVYLCEHLRNQLELPDDEQGFRKAIGLLEAIRGAVPRTISFTRD